MYFMVEAQSKEQDKTKLIHDYEVLVTLDE